MQLKLVLGTDRFVDSLAKEIQAGGLTIVDATERILGEHLEE